MSKKLKELEKLIKSNIKERKRLLLDELQFDIHAVFDHIKTLGEIENLVIVYHKPYRDGDETDPELMVSTGYFEKLDNDDYSMSGYDYDEDLEDYYIFEKALPKLSKEYDVNDVWDLIFAVEDDKTILKGSSNIKANSIKKEAMLIVDLVRTVKDINFIVTVTDDNIEIDLEHDPE